MIAEAMAKNTAAPLLKVDKLVKRFPIKGACCNATSARCMPWMV